MSNPARAEISAGGGVAGFVGRGAFSVGKNRDHREEAVSGWLQRSAIPNTPASVNAYDREPVDESIAARILVGDFARYRFLGRTVIYLQHDAMFAGVYESEALAGASTPPTLLAEMEYRGWNVDPTSGNRLNVGAGLAGANGAILPIGSS